MIKRFVYLDNAATTKLDEDALEAMKPYLIDEYANASQPYSFSRKSRNAIGKSREIIASAINCLPEEIHFTSGGTEGDNWVVKNAFFYNKNKKIITSKIEHHAVLNSAKRVEKWGGTVSFLEPTNLGLITKEELESKITQDTSLVSVMMANNEIGTIEPIKELARVAHANGSLFFTDAVQALGKIKVDVKELGVDMLSSSGHKFNGPKGVGFVYIKKGTKIVPFLDGGAQEGGLRAGTENVAYIVGMAYALEKSLQKIDENSEQLKRLEKEFFASLNTNGKEYVVNGGEEKIPGLISISFKGLDGEALLHLLDLKGIYVSTGSACDSKRINISHVLDAINLEEDWARGTIRISFGKNNRIEDAKYCAKELSTILKLL